MDLSVFTVKESKAICGYGCIPELLRLDVCHSNHSSPYA